MTPQGTAWYWFIRWCARYLVLGFFSGGMKVVGLENVPKDGPVIFAPIHVSMFDPPIVSCAAPRAVNFMAKEELFKPPVLGPLILSLGAFPVKRGAGDTSAVKLALERLGVGAALIMFPEGTRGDGKTLGEMQSGVAMIAKRSSAQVVPVGIYGSHKMLPKGQTLPKFSRLKVAFGKPFTYAETATGANERENRILFGAEMERRLVEQCRVAGLEVRTSSESASQEEPDSLGT